MTRPGRAQGLPQTGTSGKAWRETGVRIAMGYGAGSLGFVGPIGRRTFLVIERRGREVARVPLQPHLAAFILRELERNE